METLTRVFEFDAAHRIMNERIKCFNLHGHRFRVEVKIGYTQKGSLGYAIDFKEIKRIIGDWIDEHLDHACILNAQDKDLINLCRLNGWRLYVMGLGNDSWDINPSAENIASEIFYVTNQLLSHIGAEISVKEIRLYETPNCWVETHGQSYVGTRDVLDKIHSWRDKKGDVEYDIRKKYADTKEENDAGK